MHSLISTVFHNIARECGLDSSLGGDLTRCGVDTDGHREFSDVYLADLYLDRRGVGVAPRRCLPERVGGGSKSQDDHLDPDRNINKCLAWKAQQYALFGDKLVKTLAMSSGGCMSNDFHEVLYASARRKASRVFGDDGAEVTADSVADRRRCVTREKKRVMAVL